MSLRRPRHPLPILGGIAFGGRNTKPPPPVSSGSGHTLGKAELPTFSDKSSRRACSWGFLRAPPQSLQPLFFLFFLPSVTFTGGKRAAPLPRRAPVDARRRTPNPRRCPCLPAGRELLVGFFFFFSSRFLVVWDFFVFFVFGFFFLLQVAVLPPSMLHTEKRKSGSRPPLGAPALFILQGKASFSPAGRRTSISGGQAEPWAVGSGHLGDPVLPGSQRFFGKTNPKVKKK